MALTRKTNKWFVQPACATSGQGLYEGLDWLADKITSSNYHPYHLLDILIEYSLCCLNRSPHAYFFFFPSCARRHVF
eukprot:21538_5